MAKKYVLEELLKIKIKRFDKAVKIVEEKTELVIKEQEKLLQLEKDRNLALEHKNNKLKQLRDALDAGEPTHKIRQMKTYLDLVKEKLQAKQKKVEVQKEEVKKAEQVLAAAKKDLLEKQKAVEKIKIHQKEWLIELREEEKHLEAIEEDEIGTIRDCLKKLDERKKK